MPEIISRQVAKLSASATGFGKQLPTDAIGRVRCVIINTPATYTAAVDDTIGSGIAIPKGARFLSIGRIANASGAASSTLNVGLRNFRTKAAVDEDGLVALIGIQTAGVSNAANGFFFLNGIDYVTTDETELYATWKGATPTANQQLRIEMYFVAD